MATRVEQLIAVVEAEVTLDDSVLILLTGFGDMLRELRADVASQGFDPKAVDKAIADLTAKQTAMLAAVKAGTELLSPPQDLPTEPEHEQPEQNAPPTSIPASAPPVVPAPDTEPAPPLAPEPVVAAPAPVVEAPPPPAPEPVAPPPEMTLAPEPPAVPEPTVEPPPPAVPEAPPAGTEPPATPST